MRGVTVPMRIERVTTRHFLGRFTVWIVLKGLSPALGIAMAEGAESKFHPGHLGSIRSSATIGSHSTPRWPMPAARPRRSRVPMAGSSNSTRPRMPVLSPITMLAPRARTLSADPRVREVVEIAPPDSRETPPVAPRQASLTSPHRVPHQLSTNQSINFGDATGQYRTDFTTT